MSPLRHAAIDALQTLESLTANWTFVAGYVHDTILNLHKVLSHDTWVSLTKDDVESWDLPKDPTVFEFAKFIEAKIKEKNT